MVSHGESPCLSCAMQDPASEGPIIDGVQMSCSSENPAAACCRQEGNGCASTNENWCGGVGAQMVCGSCDDPNTPPTSAHVGRFVAVGQEMSIFDAIDYCESHYQSLASIHSWEEQQQAASACMAYSDATEEATSGAGNSLYGCWIGFQDIGGEGGFVWYDGSSVEYVDFAPANQTTWAREVRMRSRWTSGNG